MFMFNASSLQKATTLAKTLWDVEDKEIMKSMIMFDVELNEDIEDESRK